MRSLYSRIGGLALVAVAVFGMSGCMTTPGHYEDVGSKEDPVAFSGFLVEPNRTVRIQARVPGGTRWETIGWAYSSSRPYDYAGNDWYGWSRSIRIPDRYWIYLDGHHWADVRALDYLDNEKLYTFEAGFFGYFDVDESLTQLWNDHGHGTSVTVMAD